MLVKILKIDGSLRDDLTTLKLSFSGEQCTALYVPLIFLEGNNNNKKKKGRGVVKVWGTCGGCVADVWRGGMGDVWCMCGGGVVEVWWMCGG